MTFPRHPRSSTRWPKTSRSGWRVHYCRWDPQLKLIGLRFSNVIDAAEYAEFPSFENDPASRKWNLWSYIDARDGAQAVVRALDYQTPGFDSFVIANSDNVMTRSSADLMTEFFPGHRVPLAGRRHPIAHLHREGAAPARLDSATLLARPRLEILTPSNSRMSASYPVLARYCSQVMNGTRYSAGVLSGRWLARPLSPTK